MVECGSGSKLIKGILGFSHFLNAPNGIGIWLPGYLHEWLKFLVKISR